MDVNFVENENKLFVEKQKIAYLRDKSFEWLENVHLKPASSLLFSWKATKDLIRMRYQSAHVFLMDAQMKW